MIGRIAPWLVGALGVALAASAGLAALKAAQVRDLRADLGRAEARIEAYQEAARIHASYVRQAEADRLAWVTLRAELQSMEGRDAPLSDHLRAAAGRLFAR